MDGTILSNLAIDGGSELQITLGVCIVALTAVMWPLCKGLALCWRASAITRPSAASAEDVATRIDSLTADVLENARDQADASQSLPFVRDAAKQLVVDDYETSFAQPISMYANLLPPIGFIGTTCGLAVLLVSMRMANEALQLGALALALSSTIFALIGYAGLEALKIHLYGRLSRSIARGLAGDAAD